MKGFVQNIESLSVKNTDFRRVLYTAKSCQLVIMALKAKGRNRGPKSTSWTSSFGVRRVPVKRSSTAFGTAIRAGFAVTRPGRDESQYHQYRKCSAEALHDLLASESPGWRRPFIPRRGRGR